MSEYTSIEWSDSSWNGWIGCTQISKACENCYAEHLMQNRFGRVKWGAGHSRVRTSAANWKLPEQWNKANFVACLSCGWRGDFAHSRSAKEGVFSCPLCESNDFRKARRRVFCSSLADVFDNEVDLSWRVDLFRLIASTTNLDWLILTKRIGNAHQMLDDVQREITGHSASWSEAPWSNVWIGATICDQQEAQRDIPKLLGVPARGRFLSIEPMLGPICLDCVPRPDSWPLVIDDISDGINPLMFNGPKIDWVIVGGETGAAARPMDIDWVRALRNECVAASVAFLFKQWGQWLPGEHNGQITKWQDGTTSGPELASGGATYRFVDDRVLTTICRSVGKNRSGRSLDGVTWTQFPPGLLI